MTWLQALIMGLVQGLTEFLPVSSSAHLVFADHFMHLRLSESDTVSFDVLVHVGTLVAVLIYFRKDVWALLRGMGSLLISPKKAWSENPYSRLAVALIVGTIPAAAAGVALKDTFSAAFDNVPGTAFFLLVTAAMLVWITRRKTGERDVHSVTWKDALVVGIFQAVAILPGISRSGATMTGGFLRGLDRESAPRFSFLLSIPIIFAGGLFAAKDALKSGMSLPMPVMAVGFLTAAISGYIAVVLLLGIVKRGKLVNFAYYCAVVGIGMLFYWNMLVPKVVPSSLAGIVGARVMPVSNGELGPFEAGTSVRYEVSVTPGLGAGTEVFALLPMPGSVAGEHMEKLHFSPVAGSYRFESELVGIRPMNAEIQPKADGELQEMWLIVRNRWGIRNEVRVPVRVVPTTPKNHLT